MYKKLLKFIKEEKIFLMMFIFMLFLVFNMVRQNNTILELKIENQELIEMLDAYTPTEEENY